LSKLTAGRLDVFDHCCPAAGGVDFLTRGEALDTGVPEAIFFAFVEELTSSLSALSLAAPASGESCSALKFGST
jgi:hypothetical protein